MAAIPRYWYVETEPDGLGFEANPEFFGDLIPSPGAGDDQIVYDLHTGEIYGQAILMAALPWPRFRVFSTGQEVVLPFRMAEALEWLENVTTDLDCPQCHQKVGDWTHHYRVERVQGERFAVNQYCAHQFKLRI